MTNLAKKMSDNLVLLKDYLSTQIYKHPNKDIQNTLLETELFSHINEEKIKRLSAYIKQVSYKSGEIILSKDDTIGKIYFVKKGLVKVSGVLSNKSAQLKENDYFGEETLIKYTLFKSERNYHAVTDVEILELSRRAINKLILSNSEFKSTFNFIRKKEIVRKISEKVLKKPITLEYFSNVLKGKTETYKKGDVIFAQGDPSEYVYLILDGSIDLFFKKNNPDQDQLEIQLTKRQIFGELSTLHNKLRSGTAIVSSDNTKLLLVPNKFFLELYQSDRKFKNLINAIKYAYKTSTRGIVTLKRKSVFGLAVLSILFKPSKDRVIHSVQVIGKNIFSMKTRNIAPNKIIYYKFKDTILRELTIADDKIVGVTSFGYWRELSHVCKLILDEISIASWQTTLFQQTGSLNPNQQYGNSNEMLCYCMQVKRKTLLTAIRDGINSIDELMISTGAGSVCGCCKPDMLSLMGKDAWSVVKVLNIKKLTSDIYCYQFKPYDNKVLSYQPGQHIVLKCLIDHKWVERSYTLTSVSSNDNYYEVIINRINDGFFSHWFFAQDPQALLICLSLPQGDFTIDLNTKQKNPIVFFAAGIGLTPALAFLRNFNLQKNNRRYFYLNYSVQTDEKLICHEELINLKKTNPYFDYALQITKDQGHITEQKIKNIVFQFSNANFYICGPKGYQIDVLLTLQHLGIPSEKIKIEDFTPVSRVDA